MPLQQAQNKFKRPFKNLLFKALFFVMGAFLLSAKAQSPPSSANDALLGVPRVVDTNGNIVYIPHKFTSELYRGEALKLLLQEANQVAKDLKLSEELPITKSNLVEFYIGPFGFNYANKSIGSVTTKNYVYHVSQGNKFNDLTVADYDQVCLNYQKKSFPIKLIDTNAAYLLATNWLAAVAIDLKKLNQDCKAHVALTPFWNGLSHLGEKPKKQFVPIYFVWWTLPNAKDGTGSVAYVELFSPTKKLLQLTVSDPQYILRKPIVFTNLATLFPGVASVRTNHPVETTYPAPPGIN